MSDGAPTPRAPTIDDFPETGVNALASVGQRAWARVLDTLLVYLPVLLIATAAVVGLGPPDPDADPVELVWLPVAWVAAAGAYEVVLLATVGATLGKVVLGTRVARFADGGRPSWEQAILRSLLPLLAGVVTWVAFGDLLIGAIGVYLTAFATALRRGVHDLAGGTVVVRTR